MSNRWGSKEWQALQKSLVTLMRISMSPHISQPQNFWATYQKCYLLGTFEKCIVSIILMALCTHRNSRDNRRGIWGTPCLTCFLHHVLPRHPLSKDVFSFEVPSSALHCVYMWFVYTFHGCDHAAGLSAKSLVFNDLHRNPGTWSSSSSTQPFAACTGRQCQGLARSRVHLRTWVGGEQAFYHSYWSRYLHSAKISV